MSVPFREPYDLVCSINRRKSHGGSMFGGLRPKCVHCNVPIERVGLSAWMFRAREYTWVIGEQP